MAVKMSKIETCSVGECAYNVDSKCHAIAITVGNLTHAQCDTFYKTNHKGGIKEPMAGVGACRQENCRYNKDLECAFPSGIKIGRHKDHADCLSFAGR